MENEILEWLESVGFTNVVVIREEHLPEHIEGPWWEALGGAAAEMFARAAYFRVRTAEGTFGLYHPDEDCAGCDLMLDIHGSGISIQELGQELGQFVPQNFMETLVPASEGVMHAGFTRLVFLGAFRLVLDYAEVERFAPCFSVPWLCRRYQ